MCIRIEVTDSYTHDASKYYHIRDKLLKQGGEATCLTTTGHTAPKERENPETWYH